MESRFSNTLIIKALRTQTEVHQDERIRRKHAQTETHPAAKPPNAAQETA